MFPIWEFCLDEEDNEGQDETWVKPVDAFEIPSECYSHTVFSKISTANGSGYSGVINVSVIQGSAEVDSCVILDNGRYIFIPTSSMLNATEERENICNQLNLKYSEVFPLSYKSKVPLSQSNIKISGQYE